jgi:methionyl-tRNA formyltransferase
MNNENKNYLIATMKDWNISAFKRIEKSLPGQWHIISDPKLLTVDYLSRIKPRYIFFPHWNWVVPADILDAYECVCFHMTDVPYGRGGSPLQNLIIRGYKDTILTALRMTEKLDAGPVYAKSPLALAGRAEDIFLEAASLCYEQITDIVSTEPEPVAQCGVPICFSRRKPEQSELPKEVELDKVYDHIRMLDAPSYPKAFIDHGNYRIEFSYAKLIDGCLEAKITLTKKTN